MSYLLKALARFRSFLSDPGYEPLVERSSYMRIYSVDDVRGDL